MKYATLAFALALVIAMPLAAKETDYVRSPFKPIALPSGDGALAPFLFSTPNGDVLLSWVEGDGESHHMRFAKWHGDAFAAPREIASGKDWFVNWADVPSIAATDDGRIAAHWLQKNGGDTYAYGVRIAQSFDNGKTWSKPVTPHTDGTETEHGFVSMLWEQDGLRAIWLDGRNYAGENPSKEMSLRGAVLKRDGSVMDEKLIDKRVCDCCPTAMISAGKDVLIAYRGRSSEEVRDNLFAWHRNGEWQASAGAGDGWRIEGCPVNGPSLAVQGDSPWMTWFTVAGEKPVVYCARIDADGLAGKQRVDSGTPLGRTDLVATDDGVVVVWIETVGEGAEVRARFIPREGKPASAVRVAEVDAGRNTGYPVATMEGDNLMVVWTTQENETKKLIGMTAPIDALK